MAKEYFVTLGGRTRALRITLDDREAVEGMFPRPDGTPNNLMDLCVGHLYSVRGSLKVQAAVVWACLRQDGRTSLEDVGGWLKEAFKPGGKPIEILRPVVACISSSGVLGFTVEEKADDPEGKEQPASVPAAE